MNPFPRRLASMLLMAAVVYLFQGGLLAQGPQGPAFPSPIGATLTRTTLPYIYIGRLSVTFGPSDYMGTGTVVRPQGVLTAAHMLWDTTYGWATNVYFERGYYYHTHLSNNRPVHKYVLAGYSQKALAGGSDSDAAFNCDLGALTFTTYPGAGHYDTVWPNVIFLNGQWTTMSLGYGADYHDGEQLLTVSPPVGSAFAYLPVFSGAMYYYNDYFIIEHGMSGGPVFAKVGTIWYVVGVNISGSDYSMGIHALGRSEATFLATYMK